MENSSLSRLILVLSITLISSKTFAEDVIYRWVDEKNIVHFSQQQPAHDNYTTLSINGSEQRRATTENPNNDQAENELDEEKPKSAIDEVMTKRCEEVKANKETLISFDRVQLKNADGELTILTEAEKAQQVAIADKQIEIYCQ